MASNTPAGPAVTGADVDVSTPVPQISAPAITGTPGTGGLITIGTYHGYPVPEPHRVWKFNVFLPKLQGISDDRMPIVQQIEAGFDNVVSPESHPIGGRHHFSAGFFDATALQLLFYDDEYQNPIEYIYAWKRLMRNYNSQGIDDGTYKYPGGSTGYLKPINVWLQNMKNEDTYRIVYDGCFPVQMAPLRLDYEPSARSVISQTFAVNRILTLEQGRVSSTANPSVVTQPGAGLRNIQALQL